MLKRLSLIVLILVALIPFGPTTGFGGDEGKKATSDGTPSGAVEVRFTDGGHMRMMIAEEYLDFVTAHGKLKIPVADIRRLDLATRISEANQKLIEQSIVDLGSPQFKAREKATTELLNLREKAYPAVLKASQSKDVEIATRAKEILEKIRERVPAHRLRPREKDVIFTSDSTITGKLELNGFNVTTQQFGKVELKLTDVAGLTFLATGGETEVKLDGRYAMNNEIWLDTQVDVSENGRLTITATGEIDMYATGGYEGQYV